MKAFFNVCVLCFFVFPASSWDIAVSVKEHINFFNSNGTRAGTISQQFTDITALTYDPVFQTLYFVDSEHSNASIFSFNFVENNDIEHLVKRVDNANIQGITFDPVSEKLFWTDINGRNIYWMSLADNFDSKGRGKVLFEMDDEEPQGIAVDSCRGMIYWTNTNHLKPSIERATIEGTNREILITDDLFNAVSIAVDPGMKKMYWIDDMVGNTFKVESANLDGTNRQILYKGSYHQPYSLAITREAVYWTDWTSKFLWKLALDDPKDAQPFGLKSFDKNTPMGLVTRINILEQIEGVPECKKLQEIFNNRTDFLTHARQSEKQEGLVSNIKTPIFITNYCLNEGSLTNRKNNSTGEKICDCPKGYSGNRCEISLCHNYCLHGSCFLDSEGSPTCRCLSGYWGDRCHENVCDGFCLNNGSCQVKDGIPNCQCPTGWKGSRCEMLDVPVPTKPCGIESAKDKENNSLSIVPEIDFKNIKVHTSSDKDNYNNSYIVDISPENSYVSDSTQSLDWDVRDSIIMGLSILCVLLGVTTGLFAVKTIILKRRPRIKKRIIVNKNVTPLTCRPEPPQCEITIENCCNMNICETPCFEPEGFREQLRQTMKKEEKANLLANIEPTDMY